jgi:hypothetical protein
MKVPTHLISSQSGLANVSAGELYNTMREGANAFKVGSSSLVRYKGPNTLTPRVICNTSEHHNVSPTQKSLWLLILHIGQQDNPGELRKHPCVGDE